MWVGWSGLGMRGEAWVVFVPVGWGIYAIGCVLSFMSGFLMRLVIWARDGSVRYAMLMLGLVCNGG